MDQRQARAISQQSLQDKTQSVGAQARRTTEATNPVFQLQRTMGNRALGLLLQAKLNSVDPNNQRSLATDRGTPQPSSLPVPIIQRACTACEEEKQTPVQMKHAAASSTKSDTCPLSERKSPVMQLQSDTTRPQAAAGPTEEEAEEARPTPSEEFPDFGDGVASIEQGTYGAAGQDSPKKEEETPAPVQTKSERSGGNQSSMISSRAVLNDLGSGGAPIAGALRSRMENSFGEGFSDVRFHTHQRANEISSSLGAHAFTIGNDIAFASAKYRPDTTEGSRLIAHELTHVVQQRRGVSGDLLQRGIGFAGDEYEREADRKADEIVGQNKGTIPAGAHPEAESSKQHSASGSSSSSAIQLFSGSAAASYASTWALSTNTAYGRFDNDCTNFASQAMEAGGWTMLTGSSYCDDRTKDSVWWFRAGGCVYGVCPWSWCPDVKTINASHTWGGAQNFYDFVKSSGRGTAVAQVRDLVLGDVLQMDFGGGGHIGHTMVVTKKTTDNIYLSYHTSDHADEPFWPDGSSKGILDRNKTASYYGWNIK